jgi:hypothetical protein
MLIAFAFTYQKMITAWPDGLRFLFVNVAPLYDKMIADK